MKAHREEMVEGVTFEPVLEMTSQLHPWVFSFLAILDVPLYHRTDNATISPSSYYIDEQILLRILKPSMIDRRPSSIHGLDSVSHMLVDWEMGAFGAEGAFGDRCDDVSHWSSVPRDALFADISITDRRGWEREWNLAGRKITLLNLYFFRHYLMDLERALRRSIEEMVKGLDIQRQPGTSTAPFDVWWTRQNRSSLFINYEASSIGLALLWLVTFDIESRMRRGVAALSYTDMAQEAKDIQEDWAELSGAYATEISEMRAQFSQGTLWTTGSADDQLEARRGGLEFFRFWYDRTVDAALEAENGSHSVWLPDDGRSASVLIPRRKASTQSGSITRRLS
jgi:hypothetical protein